MAVTYHAKDRMRERVGIKNAERMAEKVLECGVQHKDTTGQLNKWITKLYFVNRTANNVRLYGEFAYLFHNEVLVTVLPIPRNLRNHVKKEK